MYERAAVTAMLLFISGTLVPEPGIHPPIVKPVPLLPESLLLHYEPLCSCLTFFALWGLRKCGSTMVGPTFLLFSSHVLLPAAWEGWLYLCPTSETDPQDLKAQKRRELRPGEDKVGEQ